MTGHEFELKKTLSSLLIHIYADSIFLKELPIIYYILPKVDTLKLLYRLLINGQ